MAAAAAAAPMARPAAAKTVPKADLDALKRRNVGKVEIAYKSPHPRPNGLQATPRGLWVQDQSPENWVTLVEYAGGKVIHEIQPDIQSASGLTVDDNNVMWIGSTYNCMHVACNPEDGRTIAKYWTPGAGRIYRKAGDPPASRSSLPPAYPPPAPPAGAAARGDRAGGRGAARRGDSGPGWTGDASLEYGHLPPDTKNGLAGTGGHGVEHRAGLLYFVVPPARRLYVMDPRTWVVQDEWPTAANRPHGIGWAGEGDSLWVSDSNLRAFFRHDIKTGRMVEKIQLTEKDPIIHGATVHDGYMWYCDDQGYICNFKL
jgi:sugar lactone lactonase YvrE